MPSRSSTNVVQPGGSRPSPHHLPEDPPLQPFTSPIGTLPSLMQRYPPTEMRITEVEVGIPAFTPTTYIPYIKNMSSSELWERIELALHYGRKVLNRPLRERRLSKREEGIFGRELDIFRDLLTNVVQVTIRDGTTGYFIQPTSLQSFMKKLKRRRSEAKGSLVAEGVPVPPLPVWGRGGDIVYVWERNEFEILAACFRVEVEGFLGTLADYHDFRVDCAPVPNSTNESLENTSMKRNTRQNHDVIMVPKSENTKYSVTRLPLEHTNNKYKNNTRGSFRTGHESEPRIWRKRTTRKILVTEVEDVYYPVRK